MQLLDSTKATGVRSSVLLTIVAVLGFILQFLQVLPQTKIIVLAIAVLSAILIFINGSASKEEVKQ